MMLDQVLAHCGHLPDVWGEGALFAFSGLDGPTDTLSGWVGTYAHEPYGLLFHTPRRRCLDLTCAGDTQPRVCTGDVLGVDTPAGALLVAYSAWHTLVGLVPAGARLTLRMEAGPAAEERDGMQVSIDPQGRDAVALARADRRLALAYGRSAAEAACRAREGLASDACAVASQRLAPYRSLPRLAEPRWDRLLRKAASVLRVNTLAAEGTVGQAWSTPDRVPHRDCWLWDTVFQSFALNLVAPRTSWETLQSVLAAQLPDGRIAHQIDARGWASAITQPPILSWGVWENWGVLRERDALEYALPRLEGYLEWDLAHRDRNGNGLLEWRITGDARCRSGESGMDNSPRFDLALELDAVDFSAFAAHDMGCLARIADALGDRDRAVRWRERADALSAQVHALLWDAQTRFYLDRALDGAFSPVRAVSGFVPLLLEDTPPSHVEALVAALRDSRQFDSAFPVASVAVSDPAWCTDMWRGATWVNYNQIIAAGLERHGRANEARRLVATSLETLERYYRRYGVLFEFYDAQDKVPPVACDRKGPHQEPYDLRRKVDAIRDYGWTAAAAVCWLLNYDERAVSQESSVARQCE
ncbi:MAG: hypothetical protein GX557_13585 [Chloroflexi bacterium]|nr:hypothetical protein [Chloroflexota bacterium]